MFSLFMLEKTVNYNRRQLACFEYLHMTGRSQYLNLNHTSPYDYIYNFTLVWITLIKCVYFEKNK